MQYIKGDRSFIGLDFDETIFPTLPHFIYWHNEEYGSKAVMSDFSVYQDWYRVFGVTREVIIERFMEFMYGYYTELNPAPFDGAIEALVNLKQAGHRLCINTSRQGELMSLTSRHLDYYFKDPKFFLGYAFGNKYNRENTAGREKWQSCELMDIRLMVEDNVQDALNLARHNVSVILFNHEGSYSWSTEESVHHRIYLAHDWEEVGHLVNNLIPKLY